jgi:hypothetical protein
LDVSFRTLLNPGFNLFPSGSIGDL